MDVTLCVVFGSKNNAVAWAGSYITDAPPTPGQTTEIHLHTHPDAQEDEPESILTEVVHSEIGEEGQTVIFLYGGEDLPDDRVTDLLAASMWAPMSEAQARDLMDIVDAAPPMAYTHDVLLIAGALDAKDENGQPALEAWNRTIAADDPLIPMFGERMYIDVLDALPLDEDEDDADLYDSAEEDDEDLPVDMEMVADENQVGSAVTGLPAVVFYAAKVDPGEAQVGFWVSSLADISGFDMVAAGWQKMTPDLFDPVEFRLAERVDLARRTTIETDVDDEGQFILTDFEMKGAAQVTESQYELLPSALVNHCRMAAEMLDLDDIVSGWVSETDDNSTK